MNDCRQPLRGRYSFFDYLYWNLLLAVPLVTALIGIGRRSAAGVVAYVILAAVMAVAVYRFFCTHCPHYRQSRGRLRCMFFWGMPRFFQPDPGPLRLYEKAIAVTAPLILALLPLVWLVSQPGWLAVYALSLLAFGVSVWRSECGRCVYFECPANRVPPDVRTGHDASR